MGEEKKEKKEKRGDPSAAVDGGGGRGRRSMVRITPSESQVGFAASSIDGYMLQPNTGDATLFGKLLTWVFLLHLVGIESVVGFLAIRAVMGSDGDFRVRHWCGPLLASVGLSVVVAVASLVAMLCQPFGMLKLSLWLAPMLMCATGVLLMDTDTGAGLAFASTAVVAAVFQSLYACWVTPRLSYAGEILSASLSTIKPSFKRIKVVAIALAVCSLFAAVFVLGVSAVAARPPHLAPLYVFFLLVSLAWTCHVIRNVVLVAISRATYRRLVVRPELVEVLKIPFGTIALMKMSFGTIVLASALSPLVVVVRGAARAGRLIAGETDQFLFSCASCYMGLADGLVLCANRWALVHVGTYRCGLREASRKVWGSFQEVGMVGLVDSDLTSSICFFVGMAGAASCSLAAAIWTLVIDKAYTTGVAAYAFLIGYLVVRIAMAWPQGCVSGYLVAYSEDPGNELFGSTISNRIREIGRERTSEV